jgi:hypothetical protein
VGEAHAGSDVDVALVLTHAPRDAQGALALVLDPRRITEVDEAAGDGDEAAREEALIELVVAARTPMAHARSGIAAPGEGQSGDGSVPHPRPDQVDAHPPPGIAQASLDWA